MVRDFVGDAGFLNIIALMKAAVHYKYGPPEVVSIQEVPQPTIGNTEVLIKVRAATVNRTDCGFRSAVYVISRLFSGLLRPKQNILGNEYAGEVVAIGHEVTRYQVGDKVFGYDDKNFACHAEYKKVKETDTLAHIPNGMRYDEAAVLTEGAHYALCDLRAAKVKQGDTVLIYGATGAIGSAAVQIAKHMGCQVEAVCGAAHIDLISNLGASKVFDYQKEDWLKTSKRYNFVFDAVGKSSFAQCKHLLKPKGIYISTELGKRSANVFLALATPMFGGKRVLFPLPTFSLQDLHYLRGLAAQKIFIPLIDRRYPLEEIVAAYKYVETGEKIGNVVIEMA